MSMPNLLSSYPKVSNQHYRHYRNYYVVRATIPSSNSISRAASGSCNCGCTDCKSRKSAMGQKIYPQYSYI